MAQKGSQGEVFQGSPGVDDTELLLKIWRLSSNEETVVNIVSQSSEEIGSQFNKLFFNFLAGLFEPVDPELLIKLLQKVDTGKTGKFLIGLMMVEYVRRYDIQNLLNFFNNMTHLPTFLADIASVWVVTCLQTRVLETYNPVFGQHVPRRLTDCVVMSLHSFFGTEAEFTEAVNNGISTRTIQTTSYLLLQHFDKLIQEDGKVTDSFIFDDSFSVLDRTVVWSNLVNRYIDDIPIMKTYSAFQYLILADLTIGLETVNVCQIIIDEEKVPVQISKVLLEKIPLCHQSVNYVAHFATLEDVETVKKLLTKIYFPGHVFRLTKGVAQLSKCLGIESVFKQESIKRTEENCLLSKEDRLFIAILMNSKQEAESAVCGINNWMTMKQLSLFVLPLLQDELCFFLDLPSLDMDELIIYKLALVWSYQTAGQLKGQSFAKLVFNTDVDAQFRKVRKVIRLSRLHKHTFIIVHQGYITIDEMRQYGQTDPDLESDMARPVSTFDEKWREL